MNDFLYYLYLVGFLDFSVLNLFQFLFLPFTKSLASLDILFQFLLKLYSHLIVLLT